MRLGLVEFVVDGCLNIMSKYPLWELEPNVFGILSDIFPIGCTHKLGIHECHLLDAAGALIAQQVVDTCTQRSTFGNVTYRYTHYTHILGKSQV